LRIDPIDAIDSMPGFSRLSAIAALVHFKWTTPRIAPIVQARLFCNEESEHIMAKTQTAGLGIHIGISEKDRAAIASGLSRLLADTYTLYLTTHNFHWNVTGPMFNTLHAMFMTQYTELWNAVDPIAERIRALGHAAPGSYGQFGKLATVPDAPATPPKALEMVRILVQGNEAVARTARELFPLVDKANDQPTTDLLTQRLDVHEKTAWMLRSLLEE
jgi:starvation-inducible DNA-binding protein